MRIILFLLIVVSLQSCFTLTDYQGSTYHNTSRPVPDHHHITLLDKDSKAKDIGVDVNFLTDLKEFMINYDQRIGKHFFTSANLFAFTDFKKNNIKQPLNSLEDFKKYQRGLGIQYGIGATANYKRFTFQTQIGAGIMKEIVTLHRVNVVMQPNSSYYTQVPDNSFYNNVIPSLYNVSLIGVNYKVGFAGIGARFQHLWSGNEMFGGYSIRREHYSSIVGDDYQDIVIGFLERKQLTTMHFFLFTRLQATKHLSANLSANFVGYNGPNFKDYIYPGFTIGINYNFKEYNFIKKKKEPLNK